MAETSNNNWVYWTLGGVAVVTLGVGAFLFFRNKNKGEEKKADTSTQQQTQTQTQTQTQYQGGSTNESGKQETTNYPEAETTYFGSKQQGNAFRRWVRAKDPNFAKEIDLSKSGDYNNSNIKKAYAKYGADFQNVNKNFLEGLAFGLNNPWRIERNGDAYYESGDANNGARFTLDRNGRLFVEGRKNGGLGVKWQSGGWYIDGNNNAILLFKDKEYSSEQSNIQNQAVWEIWNKAGLWSGSAFTPFVDFANMIDSASSNDFQDEML